MLTAMSTREDKGERPVPAGLITQAPSEQGRMWALRVLWRFLARHRVRFWLAVMALLVAAGSVLALGQTLRLVVDRGFLDDDPAQLNLLLLVTMGVILLLAVASALRFYLVSWIGERVAADLRQAVFDHVTRQPPSFFELNGVGEIQSRLTTDTSVLQTILGASFSIAVRNGLLLIGALVLLFITSPRLTGLVLATLPLVLGPVVFFGRRVRRLSRASQDRVADVGSFAGETLHGIRTVQAFCHEAVDRQRFRRHVDHAFDTAVLRVRQRAWLVGMALILAFSAVGLILWQGGHDVLAGRMTAGELAAFVFYAVLAAGATGAVSEVSGELFRAAGATERLTELLNSRPQIRAPARAQKLPRPVRGAIRLEEVGFAYPGRPERPVLSGVDLHIEPGERVALVGPSGAGKSTLFALLLRFYDPDRGRVCLDDIDLRELDPADVRSAIGLVAQETTLFTGTAWENIRYGREDADDEAIVKAAEAAHCMSFLSALPQGLETPLGPGGVQLSGGQRQRIAIARAILRDPALLLLDEATSNLDAESESRIQVALEQLMRDRTSLVIAHRLATVTAADRILVMQDGRLQAQGTHTELLRSSPLYAHLAALQFPGSRG